MPKVSETLRELVQGREYRVAADTGLQYRVVREFALGTRSPRAETIDALAEYFDLELKPITKPKGRRAAGPKPRKPT